MRTRALSSIGVVVVGIVPALLGGPAFAVLMAALGVVGYREFLRLCTPLLGGPVPVTGYAAVVAFAVAGLLDGTGAIAVAAFATGAPLVAVLARSDGSSAVVAWGLAVAGSLYLGLPVYAGVALRAVAGEIDVSWLRSLATAAAIGDGAPRGLAWVLIVVLATWLGDTSAYLVGRAWGRRLLLPRVSPKKTIEGALGGLVGSTVAGGLGVVLFGLGVPSVLGAAVGLALGGAGQVGDLAESMLKRQAGVKDSGTLIPGHGGVLDRIDALLFALTLGWVVVPIVDWMTR